MLIIKIMFISILAFLAGMIEAIVMDFTNINISRFLYILLGIFTVLIWKG